MAFEDGRLDADRWASYQKRLAALAVERRKEDPRARAENRRLWTSRTKGLRARSKEKWSGKD